MSNVKHPAHYNTGSIEVIDAIEDWKLGFHLGNAVKYIARAGKKNKETKIEDLEKAAWYLNRYLEKRAKKKLSKALGVPHHMIPEHVNCRCEEIKL